MIKNNDTSYGIKYLLSNDVKKTVSKKGIVIRKIIAPKLRKEFAADTKYKLIVDYREELKKTKKGKIFIVNHRQSDDIVSGVNAIGESGFIVFGNKILVLESFRNGYGLWANGVIILDRDDPESRQACFEKMKYIIEHGGNVIIYPEGYWNLEDNGLGDEIHKADDHNSENWLIQDINFGCIRLAKETGCEMVPTVLHYDETKEKKCYAKRGKPILVNKNDNIFEKKQEILDEMTNMYWQLMEKYSSYSREELEPNGISLKKQWKLLKKELIAARYR